MNPNLISETIRKSIEERKRRQQAQAAKKEPDRAEPAGPPDAKPSNLSGCAAEVDRAVRESVLSSFSQWEVKLIPEIEGLFCQAADGAGGPPAGDAGAVHGSGSPGPNSPSGPGAGSGGPGVPPAGPDSAGREAPEGDGDSWETLARAVRELRREWDQETFESCFGESGSAPLAEAETEELFAPAQTERPASGAPPEAPTTAPPRPDSARAPSTQTPGAETPAAQTPASGRQPPAPSPELAAKLDELIRLVKSSISAGGSGRVPVVPPELTREIAREVAGRLKDTMAPAPPNPPKPGAGKPPPPSERIPLDDVASIIDQITGSTPP